MTTLLYILAGIVGIFLFPTLLSCAITLVLLLFLVLVVAALGLILGPLILLLAITLRVLPVSISNAAFQAIVSYNEKAP